MKSVLRKFIVSGLFLLLAGVPAFAQVSATYHPSTAPLIPLLVVPNATSTGTTVATLTKLTGVNTAVIAATTDNKNGQIVGIAVSGAGTSGSVTLMQEGAALCLFDPTSVVQNDFVTASSTVAGSCHDAGSTLPGDGSQVLGRVASPSAAGSLPYTVIFNIVPGGLSTSLASVQFCGATSGATQACAKTVESPGIIVFGNVTLSSAATQAITTLPFTAAGDYSCWGSDYTNAAGIVSFSVYASGASATIKESGGGTSDVLYYSCIGF